MLEESTFFKGNLCIYRCFIDVLLVGTDPRSSQCYHREPTQSVCVADRYFIVNVLDLPFASPIAFLLTMYINQ